MDLVLHNLTVAVVKLRRPPDHAVGLPVPDALDQLVLQVLLPGKGLAWTGVRDCVTKLPLLVRPGHIHSHQRGRDSQTAASVLQKQKSVIEDVLTITHGHIPVESLGPISY